MAAIVKTDDVLGGKARLEGRRISVYQIGETYVEAGRSPEEIADQLDISLAEVHAALTYYYEHREEMDVIRDRREEIASRLRERSRAPERLSQ